MNISFKGVTPLVGRPGSLKTLEDNLKTELGKGHPDYILQNATGLYKKGLPGPNGQLTQAVEEGKEVGFLITGDNVDDVMLMRHGWGSETGPSRHINNDILNIDDIVVTVKKAAELIISKF